MTVSIANIVDTALLPRPGPKTQQPPALDRIRQVGDNLITEHERSGAAGIERQLIDEGGVRTAEDIGRISDDAGRRSDAAFRSARGTLSRQQRGLGVNLTDRERRSQSRRLGLAQVLSNVDARNRALEADQQRREVIRREASGLRDIIDQSALRGLSTAAAGETSREIEFRRAKAEAEQARSAGLGQLAGLAVSFAPGGQFAAPFVSGAVK